MVERPEATVVMLQWLVEKALLPKLAAGTHATTVTQRQKKVGNVSGNNWTASSPRTVRIHMLYLWHARFYWINRCVT